MDDAKTKEDKAEATNIVLAICSFLEKGIGNPDKDIPEIITRIRTTAERLAKIEVLEELQKEYINSGLTAHGMRSLLNSHILELKAVTNENKG